MAPLLFALVMGSASRVAAGLPNACVTRTTEATTANEAASRRRRLALPVAAAESALRLVTASVTTTQSMVTGVATTAQAASMDGLGGFVCFPALQGSMEGHAAATECATLLGLCVNASVTTLLATGAASAVGSVPRGTMALDAWHAVQGRLAAHATTMGFASTVSTGMVRARATTMMPMGIGPQRSATTVVEGTMGLNAHHGASSMQQGPHAAGTVSATMVSTALGAASARSATVELFAQRVALGTTGRIVLPALLATECFAGEAACATMGSPGTEHATVQEVSVVVPVSSPATLQLMGQPVGTECA